MTTSVWSNKINFIIEFFSIQLDGRQKEMKDHVDKSSSSITSCIMLGINFLKKYICYSLLYLDIFVFEKVIQQTIFSLWTKNVRVFSQSNMRCRFFLSILPSYFHLPSTAISVISNNY